MMMVPTPPRIETARDVLLLFAPAHDDQRHTVLLQTWDSDGVLIRCSCGRDVLASRRDCEALGVTLKQVEHGLRHVTGARYGRAGRA